MVEAFTIKIGSENMNFEDVCKLLKCADWAKDRSKETIWESIKNSRCYGVFIEDGRQVGFARAITDYATTFYLCDVIIDKEYRGHGMGKALLQAIKEDEAVWNLKGLLLTKTAAGLYQKFGFIEVKNYAMYKDRESK